MRPKARTVITSSFTVYRPDGRTPNIRISELPSGEVEYMSWNVLGHVNEVWYGTPDQFLKAVNRICEGKGK